jgi:hypothetical protein
MKALNVASLRVPMGWLTLTPNVYAQVATAIPMASGPDASSNKATLADKKLARDVRKALSKAPNFNGSNVFVKARITVHSAQRIERDATLPSQKSRRYWRSCPDLFDGVRDTDVVPMLTNAPQLQAITTRSCSCCRTIIPGNIRTAHGARLSGARSPDQRFLTI